MVETEVYGIPVESRTLPAGCVDGHSPRIIRPQKYCAKYPIKIITYTSSNLTALILICPSGAWNVTILSRVMKWNISIKESHTVKIVIGRLRRPCKEI